MKGFIETTRAKTGQRVAIRISEIATISECASNTSCIVTKKGEAYHTAPSYDELARMTGLREQAAA